MIKAPILGLRGLEFEEIRRRSFGADKSRMPEASGHGVS